ncbi:NUDIX domain-containing protein [Nucisporomicrobium flavum]|uniref:NUDIX domain-containing protein n=1 Tax=Nucisporomicrobium flavum TaxID=2785915 RepID=UPI001F248478|nr:NUDIX domain-containing protein [Nucisporomicrobium flavum]
MVPGRDYVGVGVGAVVRHADGRVFLARRGPAARNEAGCWEFPGGTVDFGETLEETVRREFREEYGMEVEVTGLLGVADHLLPEEGQHWVSVSYAARHVGGVPEIREPGKCTEIGWFDADALPEPLSEAAKKARHP